MGKLLIAFALLLSVPAFAKINSGDVQATEPRDESAAQAQVTTLKQKVTCEVESVVKLIDENNSVLQEYVDKGLSQISLRTVWKEGDVEYRISDYTSYSQNGTKVVRQGRNLSRITRTQNNDGSITEKNEYTSVTLYVDELYYSEGRTKSNWISSVSEDTYKKVGNQLIYSKSLLNGKEQPITGVVTEEIVNPDLTILTYTEATPIVQDAGNGSFLKTEKSVSTCKIETVP